MPRLKGSGKGLNKPITVRLPPDEEAFYRGRAQQNGMSLSAFLTKTLVAGAIAENMQEFEQRIQALIAKIPTESHGERGLISPSIVLSVLTCEALLTAIVEAQDPQVLYRAQDAAREKVKRLLGGSSGAT